MASTSHFMLLSVIALSLVITNASSVGFSVELIHRDHPKSPFYNPTVSKSDCLHAAVRRSHVRAMALHRIFFSGLYSDISSMKNSDSPPPPPIDASPYPYPSPSDFPADSPFPYPSPSDSPFPSPADSPIPYPPPSDSPSHAPSPQIETDIIANSVDYLMSIRLGTPTRQIIVIADTGSDLIWITCKPCTNCYEQDAPLFDPAKTTSYANLPCNSKQCNQLPSPLCDNSTSASTCIYQYGYGDGSQTSGNLAQETITFNTTSGNSVGFPKVAFGCSHVANGSFERHSAGLVGLGGGPLSLVSQLGSSIAHRFSYCLVPYGSANVTTSQLNFGANAVISGDGVETTKMVQTGAETFYTTTLDSITVGKNNTLGSIQKSYIIVDSGTTLTYFDSTVLQSLVETLGKIIHLPQVEDSEKLFPLCFNESGARSNLMYPDITLQLGQATITLKPYNAFVKIKEDVRCLAMSSSDGIAGTNLSILGNIAQQNFRVGFDLASRKMSFVPADCTKF